VFDESSFHRGAIEQIEIRAVGGEQLVVTGALEGAADGAAGHSTVADSEDAASGGDQLSRASNFKVLSRGLRA